MCELSTAAGHLCALYSTDYGGSHNSQEMQFPNCDKAFPLYGHNLEAVSSVAIDTDSYLFT